MAGIKVFLVEDESIIRNGIKKGIHWEEEGFQFVGEASDGELAYPMILKERPDILITDIKMPFMDGLELSRLVRMELPDIKILILSGYNEFEYAKEAIRIGVTEYILKPISAAKLLEVLREVGTVIRQEQKEKDLLKKYAEDMRENLELEKVQFFHRLVKGELSAGDIISEGKRFELNLSSLYYQIILFKLLNNKDADPKLVSEACDEIDLRMSKRADVMVFHRGIDGWVFVLCANEQEEIEKACTKVMTELKNCMKERDTIEYFGGIGSVVMRTRNLGISFKEAEHAFAARFFQEPNQFVQRDNLDHVPMNRDCQIQDFSQIGQSRSMIERFLNNGTIEEVESFTDSYMGLIQENNLKSTLMRQYIMMDVHIVILAFIEKISSNETAETDWNRQGNDLLTNMQRMNSLSEIRSCIIQLLQKAINLRDELSGRRYSDIILTAKEMIEREYMLDTINLNAVASKVGMSPSYFSSVFSNEVGQTFVEYLTQVRMNHAKELLMCSGLRSSEIGYQVGYKDAHYFSYLFKKTQGCSPKEYRNRKKEMA